MGPNLFWRGKYFHITENEIQCMNYHSVLGTRKNIGSSFAQKMQGGFHLVQCAFIMISFNPGLIVKIKVGSEVSESENVDRGDR